MQPEPRDRSRPRRFLRTFPALGCLALAGLLMIAAAPPATKIKNFRVPQYDDPPNETRMKSLLQGAEAEPDKGGLIQIKGLDLLTFDDHGDKQMTIQSPRCTFDPTLRNVTSSSRLQVRSADGKFYLEGEGFCWQQTNSILTISNNVQILLEDSALNSFVQ